MEEEYKSWLLRYDEQIKRFVAGKTVGDEKIELQDIELLHLRKKCDAYDKQSKGFKRTPCYDNNLLMSEITSVVGTAWDDDIDVWISRKEESESDDGWTPSTREKTGLKHLYKATKENEEKIQKIKQLRKEAYKLEKSLERLNKKDFEKYVVK